MSNELVWTVKKNKNKGTIQIYGPKFPSITTTRINITDSKLVNLHYWLKEDSIRGSLQKSNIQEQDHI
jgi:hypothetical protein